MKAYIVQIQCVTNMHVGNGDVNYNIIDNEVERDSVTNYPTINASGVKGALREYFKSRKVDTIEEIFGAETGERSKPGKVKILGAEMVALPGRATDGKSPFYMVTTEAAIKRINELSTTFIGKEIVSAQTDLPADDKAEIEGFRPQGVSRSASKNLYILQEKDFNTIDLPVLARNKLDNGISKNLWYEEVVPHDSIFIFPVVSEDENLVDQFATTIKDQVVQFGGNASIGYGLCKVTIYG